MAGESASYDDKNEVEGRDIKDTLRPRRTRAMRACLACHERHITCGMHHLPCISTLFQLNELKGGQLQ
jgi:hypothetical protein